jgi:hypothetical protein
VSIDHDREHFPKRGNNFSGNGEITGKMPENQYRPLIESAQFDQMLRTVAGF